MQQAIIYSRISSKNQAYLNNVHLSIDTQKSSCIQYGNHHNFNIQNIFSEIKSAKDMRYLYTLNSILQNYKNVNLIISNVSRLSRNIIQGIEFIKQAASKNIIIHFVNDNAITNNHSDFHKVKLLLCQSQYESEQISIRVKANNKHLKSKGWQFGLVPYGYHAIKEDGIRKFKYNTQELNIINFISTARKGNKSSTLLNIQLNQILPHNTHPIEFVDKDESIINYFDKEYTLTFGEIADLLNSYDITKRGNIWTAYSVNNVYNNQNNNFNKSFHEFKI